MAPDPIPALHNSSLWCSNNGANLSEACLDLVVIPQCCYPGFSDHFIQFASVFYLLIAVVGTVENLLNLGVLTYAWKYHFKESGISDGRNFSTLLLISYSFSEVIYCCFILPLIGMTYIHRSWPYGHTLCHVMAYTRRTLTMTSWNNVATMIFSSALHNWSPFAYKIAFETIGGVPAIACLWAISFIAYALLFLNDDITFGYNARLGQCMIMPGKSERAYLTVGISDMIPFFVTVISFVLLWIKLHRSRKEVTSVADVSLSTREQLLARERRMALVFTLLAVGFILPILPVVLTYLCCWENSSSTAFSYMHILATTHVVISFCIYFLRTSYYRSALIFFLTSMKRKLYGALSLK